LGFDQAPVAAGPGSQVRFVEEEEEEVKGGEEASMHASE
jgi:hypothetical protein